MNIIYHCYGGAHSSVMAAAIHLGHVTRPKNLALAEVVALPYFDIQDDGDMGCLRQVGFDCGGHGVYVMGRDRFSLPMQRLFAGLAHHAGLDAASFVTTDAISYVNPLMVIGGYLSRRLRLKRLGRAIVAFGTRLASPYLASAVEATKARAMDLAKLTPYATTRLCDKIVVYYGSGSALSAIVAAAMHTERISPARPPRFEEIRELIASLGGLKPAGEVVGLGRDKSGATVLAVGCSLATGIMSRACLGFLEISGMPASCITMIESPKLSGSGSVLGCMVDRLLRRNDLQLRLACCALRVRFGEFATVVQAAAGGAARLDPAHAADG